MKPHAIAAAMGFLTAAVLAPGGQSEASPHDPTGFWVKPDSERNAKIEITKCGKGNAQLCSKIIWLENPHDSRGRLLHDVRNENPSMRDRPILGLPLFTGLTRTGPKTWTGKIYNPEDGNTYAATLTFVSHKQITLKGCKAWLLCGERVWLRTAPPPKPQPEPEQEPLVEAKAEPAPAPPAETHAAAASIPSRAMAPASPPPAPPPDDPIAAMAEPSAEIESQADTATMEPQAEIAAPQLAAALPAEPVTPAPAPSKHDQGIGYGFLDVPKSEVTATRFSGENVPSLFTMTDPIETEEGAPPANDSIEAVIAATEPMAAPGAAEMSASVGQETVPLPDRKPAVRRSVKAQATVAAAPSEETGRQAALSTEPEEAETATEVSPPLTRRQKRVMRKQQRGLLPWLR
jgi:uncharacterized protein (DUF2147 family)